MYPGWGSLNGISQHICKGFDLNKINECDIKEIKKSALDMVENESCQMPSVSSALFVFGGKSGVPNSSSASICSGWIKLPSKHIYAIQILFISSLLFLS